VTGMRAICFPASDVAFGHVVHRVLASEEITHARELEDRLRPLYPMAQVRAHRAGSEAALTWDVFRDRDFPMPADPEWWVRDDVPALLLEVPKGTVIGFNHQAVRLFDHAADDLMGMPYQRLVHPEAIDAASSVWNLLLARGALETVVAILRGGGRSIVVEARARVNGEVVEARYRAVGLVTAAP
jgi:PAS domain-containing protein